MHPFAHLQSIIIASTKIHGNCKNNSYEQEPPLITICANFQVCVCVWGGGGGGGRGAGRGSKFFPACDYEFIVFWKSFEY